MLIAILILASSVIGLANPYLLKLMIDDAFPKGDIGLLGLYAALMVIVPVITAWQWSFARRANRQAAELL